LDCQEDAFSNGSPEKQEREQNNPANCKTVSAAQWLASETNPPRPIVPNLRKTFALSAKEACEAIRLANALRRAA